MKRLFVGLLAGGLLLAVAAVSLSARRPDAPTTDLRLEQEARNPWTNLRLHDDRSEFQFAIVTDRTGGARPGVFERAVGQLNLLQPAFVLSVGDLIEGSSSPERLTKQWQEFDAIVGRLEMPFFYVAGNHDVGNKVSDQRWREKFGRRHYHFVYKDVLFLILNTEDAANKKSNLISDEQVEYARKVLAAERGVRWTVVAIHKPLWTYPNVEATNWLKVEEMLAGRPYTVFAGHKHRYEKFERNGQRYYMLATTGGSSQLRGLPFGEFDQIVWVTMKKDGPRLANLMVEGIFADDLNTTGRAKSGASAAR